MTGLRSPLRIYRQEDPEYGCIPAAVRSAIHYLGSRPPDEALVRTRMMAFENDRSNFRRMKAVLPMLGFQLHVTEHKTTVGSLLAIGRHLAADEPVLICGEFFDVPPTNSRRVHCFVVSELGAPDGLLVHDAGTGRAEQWSLETFRTRFTGDVAVVRRNDSPAPLVD